MTQESHHVKPYVDQGGKKEQVREMFDNISSSYDLLNKLLSVGMDRKWRKKAVAILGNLKDGKVLDVATGTGDVAFAIARANPGCKVTGLDLAPKMLEIAERKSKQNDLADRVDFILGESENIPYADNSYDGVTVAFGVRNFENLGEGLKEMHRVLKPGGQVVVLEFTRPRIFPFKQLFGMYFKYILPMIGGLKSGDQKAYKYLFESVQAFPDYDKFVDRLHEAGFKNGSYNVLSLGICAVYRGVK